MICTYCSRPIIPHAPRIEIDGRGPAHVGCAMTETARKAVAEMEAKQAGDYQRPVVWENGRNLTVHFEGPLKGCEGRDIDVDVKRDGRYVMMRKCLGKPLSFGLKVSVYEIPRDYGFRVRRGDEVRLIVDTPDADIDDPGIECENRSVVDADGCVATGGPADRGSLCAVCGKPVEEFDRARVNDGPIGHALCLVTHQIPSAHMHWGLSGFAGFTTEPENSDRLIAPETQQLSTFTSRRFPGMHVAVVGFQGADYPPNKVEEAINDPGLETMLMSLRFKRVVEAVIEITGTENVACRFASLDRDLRRMSILIHRQGVFQHDHALWAEFLRMIG